MKKALLRFFILGINFFTSILSAGRSSIGHPYDGLTKCYKMGNGMEASHSARRRGTVYRLLIAHHTTFTRSPCCTQCA